MWDSDVIAEQTDHVVESLFESIDDGLESDDASEGDKKSAKKNKKSKKKRKRSSSSESSEESSSSVSEEKACARQHVFIVRAASSCNRLTSSIYTT